jgi:sensor histidine kinase YesM
MRWHEFVFSNQPRHRNRRHLVCWLLWWLYIVFTIFFTREISPKSAGGGLNHHQPGLNELGYLQYSLLVIIKSFLLLFTHLFFCYAVIYILLPGYLSKKKYWRLVTGVLLLCILMIPVGYFLYSLVYPYIDDLFSLHSAVQYKTIVYASIDAGLVNAIRVTLVAAAITLLKQWWLKQKEKENLEKEKINAELQLLKAQVHPAFLFSTLNNIISHARMASPKAPEMLIKLSDLLSYMLYECDAPKVKLEKEIGMIKEYMALEKIRQGEKLEMTFQIKGNCNGQLISPLLLLPFIDNSFSYSNNELVEQAWVNLDITIEDKSLSMKLINGMPSGIHDDTGNNEHSLANVQKRLQLLYPGRHELKINAEQELLMVHLNLKLEEATQEDQNTAETTKTVLSHAGV